MTGTGSVQGQQQGRIQHDQAAAAGGALQHRRCLSVISGAGALLLLAGCSQIPSSINPVSWWHDMQGGAIAQDRPPPPGATDPYPNLASVPSKPEQSDPKARAQVADALVADRSNAQYAAAQAPLADPSSRAASPQLFGVGTAAPPPPPSATAASATLEAANAPPPPAAGPTPSGPPPGPPINATPPAPTAAPTAARASNGPTGSPGAPSAAASAGRQQVAQNNADAPLAPSPAFASNAPVPPEAPGSLPPLPAGPPPAPSLPGAPPTVPTPVAAPKPPPGKPAAPVIHDPMSVAFPPGSAELPNNYRGPLKALADKRGQSSFIVVGYGEARRTDPHDQSTGLSLGLARAQAIAAALAAAGVPPDKIQVDAEAAGRGGAVRLVD